MRAAVISFSAVLIASTLSAQTSAPSSTANLPANERLVLFDALCKGLRDNYPMLEFAGWQDSWEAEFRARVQAAPSVEAAYDLMDELVCRLNDYHTRLFRRDQPHTTRPNFQVEPVLTAPPAPGGYGIWSELRPPFEMPALEGVTLAVVRSEESGTMKAGDEIIAVNGVSVEKALSAAWKHSIGCSVAGKLRWAAMRMLSVPESHSLEVKVRRKGGTEAVVKPRLGGGDGEPTLSTNEIAGVPIIRIARWNGRDLVSQFDGFLEKFRTRPGLVIDVRGNGGGEDELASQIIGRFVNKPVISSISFHRVVPGLTFERTVEYTPPRGPWRYEGRVAILVDEGCMSACEHFVSGMIEAGALACGTPTSGACGWIRGIQLAEGVRLNVSQTFPLHTAGIPSPQLGIAPHLWALQTLDDLRGGKDTALEKAIGWIKSPDPLPTRLQPMTPFSR